MSEILDKHEYRQDIDGLRAIAVIFVILFHAGIGQVVSGFIGVDVFFVISGFLITGIIIKQQDKGLFRLCTFFAHRLWRIQPAFIAMSLVTLLIAVLFYLPEDFLAYLHSAKYNSLFLSNQFFARQSASYASPDASLFLLLHTWSLAIEWQWYLVLPIALTLSCYLVNLPGLPNNTKKRDYAVETAWLVITALMAVLALILAAHVPGGGYYSLFSRIFEFMSGGAAFFLGRYNTKIPAPIANVGGVLSLACLLYVALQPDIMGLYPNIYALLVAVASALIIFFGSYKNSVASRILSLEPVAFTGRISYSLYLWHWPIMATTRYLGYSMTGAVLYIVLALTVVISIASFYLIEQPFRRCHWPLKSTVPILVITPIIVFNLFYFVAGNHYGLPARFGADYNRVALAIDDAAATAGHRPDCLDGPQDPNRCMFGDLSSHKTALLIGDSTSNQFWGFFEVLAHDAHIKMTALSTPSCLALPEIYQFDWWKYHNVPYTKCHDNTVQYYNLIKNNHYDYVIIGEIWEQYANGPYLINGVNDERSEVMSKERMNNAVHKALDFIVASGARPIFIRTIAAMPHDYMQCIRKHVIFRYPYAEKECDQQYPQGTENTWTLALFSQLQKEYPTLQIFDPKKIQCQSGKCITAINGVPIYRDVGHINDFAAYYFVSRYLKDFGNPLL